jgi:hypothetical protein
VDITSSESWVGHRTALPTNLPDGFPKKAKGQKAKAKQDNGDREESKWLNEESEESEKAAVAYPCCHRSC